MALVMILGFNASCCPLATVGSVGKKVPSVAERPGRPNWKSMAGEHEPNSEAFELAARGRMWIEAAEAVAAAKKARRRVLVCILILEIIVREEILEAENLKLRNCKDGLAGGKTIMCKKRKVRRTLVTIVE